MSGSGSEAFTGVDTTLGAAGVGAAGAGATGEGAAGVGAAGTGCYARASARHRCLSTSASWAISSRIASC
jgi:hypothetical protein